MDTTKKQEKMSLSDLPKGLQELVDLGSPQHAQKLVAHSGKAPTTILLPAATQQAPARPKTQKEQELDELISKRQSIIESLKAKNPLVLASRQKIAAIIPSVRGKGAPQAIRLMEEAEKIEFSIATEAYTPKKEKDLIKRLRVIKKELSKHKELEAAQKKVDAERSILRSIMNEIRSLEHELASCRAACEQKYNEILAERKAAYESRVRKREEKAQKFEQEKQQVRHRYEQEKQKRFEHLKERVHQEKRREYDDEMAKYMKKHDDTVSMDEIVQIEKKEKKEKKKD